MTKEKDHGEAVLTEHIYENDVNFNTINFPNTFDDHMMPSRNSVVLVAVIII